jgi:hypothetical protein
MNWTSGPFTAASLFIAPTIASLSVNVPISRHSYVNESNNQGWSLSVLGTDFGGRSDKFEWDAFNNNAVASYGLTSTISVSPLSGKSVLMVGTSDGTTRRLFINGLQDGSTTNSPVPASLEAITRLGQPTSAAAIMSIYWGACWRRVLTAGEVRKLWMVSSQPGAVPIGRSLGSTARLTRLVLGPAPNLRRGILINNETVLYGTAVR